MFGGLDAVRAAKQAAEKFTPEDLECARLERNDSGNGERLRKRFGEKLMFARQVGWHWWTGKYWSFERGEDEAEIAADDTHTAIFAEAKALAEAGPWPKESIDDFNLRVGGHLRWAVASGNRSKITGMIEAARPRLTRGTNELDADHYLFNCDNCTIDLTDPLDIKKRRHNHRDLITRISPVKYDPKAPAPVLFQKFLDRILPDKQVQLFMQQWAGVALTGDVSVQSLIVQHGQGANGKSTLEDVLRHIYGDYALTIAFASLNRDEHRTGAAPSPDLARLRGCRAAFASEPEHSVKFSEGLIKQITGGTKITARYLNKEFFEYLPGFKLFLACNHKPIVQGADVGIWRRLKLVPFEVTIPQAERDPLLADKLKTESSGILNWMIDGYRFWRDRGSLLVPDAVVAATAEYAEDSDPIGLFVSTAIERTVDGHETSAALYSAYKVWCGRNAVRVFSYKAFGGRLAADFQKHKGVGGLRGFRGLRLKPEWRTSANEPPPYEPPDVDERDAI